MIYLKILSGVLALFVWACLGAVIVMTTSPEKDGGTDDLHHDRGLRIFVLLLGILWPVVISGFLLAPLVKKIGDPTLIPVHIYDWLVLRWVLLKERFQ